jgi:hydrogenase-1 operon protein HyaF
MFEGSGPRGRSARALEVAVSRLADIPIRIEPGAPIESAVPFEAITVAGGLGGGVAAILSELATLLERLVRGDPPRSIDLRSLPMSPRDRAALERVLGEGEVQATVNAQGLSKMRETRVSGIWWVEHFDQQGELIAELIEVSRVPEMLGSAFDEMAAGARDLRAQISASAASWRGAEHASES